uniref:Peptidase S1 domain-containing protein n=1 Tax=Graphocephala atropunctata TaxID=36148 RepID=A0A1B6MFF4_9HEMI
MSPEMNFVVYFLAAIQFAIYHEVSSQKVSIITELKEKPKESSLMVNAQEFLWHVAVLQEGETGYNFLCSGTVIHSRFVLTAANCVADVLPSQLKVVAGLNALNHVMDTVDSPHSIYSVSEQSAVVMDNRHSLAVSKPPNYLPQ